MSNVESPLSTSDLSMFLLILEKPLIEVLPSEVNTNSPSAGKFLRSSTTTFDNGTSWARLFFEFSGGIAQTGESPFSCR